MQVGSAFNAGQAMAQVSRSVEQLNQLNQKIVDAGQSMDSKLLKMNVEAKVQNPESGHSVDFTA